MNDEATNEGAEDSDAAKREFEHDLYEEEIDEEIAWDDRRFDWLLNLIAWTCRQKADPKPLSQWCNWPEDLNQNGEYDPYEDNLLRSLAFKDPIFFDLARTQTADLVERVGEDLSPEDIVFIAKLLRAEPPLRRRAITGDNFGRDALIVTLLQLVVRADLWGLEKRLPRLPGARPTFEIGVISDTSLSDGLSEILCVHPLLEKLPNAVPSSDAIRVLWRRRGKFPNLVPAFGSFTGEFCAECIWVGLST